MELLIQGQQPRKSRVAIELRHHRSIVAASEGRMSRRAAAVLKLHESAPVIVFVIWRRNRRHIAGVSPWWSGSSTRRERFPGWRAAPFGSGHRFSTLASHLTRVNDSEQRSSGYR